MTCALVTGLIGCARHQTGQPTPPSAAGYPQSMRQKVSADAMFSRLEKLQQIADANSGNRAVGTPGYDASVEYIVKTLRDSGFDVQTPEFDFRQFEAGPVSVSTNGAPVAAQVLQYSAGTGQTGVSGPLVAARADDTPGCSASEYDGLAVAGAVVLVDRGSCPFADKEAVAVQRGAVGLIIADNVDEDRMGGTLGAQSDVKIPVVSVSKADGARLRSAPGPITLKFDVTVKTIKARNVIAQTKTGSAQNVVMVGAHLDSVAAGPGINDNGSGVAAVLETAVQMGPSPPVQNAVRFAFWGAEELGLIGSQKYVQSLDENALKDIALYLNFDMLASPNPGYFTYDGDQSPPDGPNANPTPAPDGSAAVERTLVAYLSDAGKKAENVSFGGRSDYDAFNRAGIPSAGLFSGAEEKMNAEQARLWGGNADQPFDPNYHRPTDTLQHIDRTALGINGSGVAYVVALYAQDLGGPNGVPVRGDRTRQVLKVS
ncbi:MAG: M20/M25/M40 family metallo-hydrolase [Mycobacteriaceae bacterium]|nr:M20/M25/M40 family metallo-hydrolase [Mycobacteriaceae bacterium]